MTTGRIHSIESSGLVDGPGVRTVIFFQGCHLRCAYCHNPDTWLEKEGIEIEAEALVKKILRYKPYFEKSGGGVTFSGGDPLLQPKFLIEVLKLCKNNGIHTALDTAGFGRGSYEEILKYIDLVILDIKHVDNEGYKELTGRDKNQFNEFLETVEKSNTPLWIRHVVVPGITDSYEHIHKLAEIIKNIKNVEKIELLPYHVLGEEKYDKIGIPYRLKGIEPMDKDRVVELEEMLINEVRKTV